MNKIDKETVNDAKIYVTELLEKNLPKSIEFHTAEHARYVAESAEKIGIQSGLTEDEVNFVKLCAWFHDTGYISDPKNHEEKSAEIAAEFLKTKNIDDKTISEVRNCILTTRTPQHPDTLVSQVLCDADLSHFSEDFYFDLVEKMRKEQISLFGKNISKKNFYITSEAFFQKHRYHTDFGKKELQAKKEKILKKLQNEIKKSDKKKTNKGKKKKTKGYSRGVESMLRNTARMQINLSSIADKKSNILISVNTIIMSISMTVLISQSEETPNIILPILIVLLFSLVTVIFAILSTRPIISSGTFTEEDIKKNKVNLLFFGNFYNMELEEYEKAIRNLMKNETRLYSTMIYDQYYLGKVLAKKYKLLRISYNIFMAGMIISVFSFVLAFINI